MSKTGKGMIIGGIISTTSFTIGLIMAKLLFIQPTIQMHECNHQPIIPQIESTTNSVERANMPQNLNWFKENNKYIWDGWKIK